MVAMKVKIVNERMLGGCVFYCLCVTGRANNEIIGREIG